MKAWKIGAIVGAVWRLVSSAGNILFRPDVINLPFREIIFLPSYILVSLFNLISPNTGFFILHIFPVSIPITIFFGTILGVLIFEIKARVRK